MNLSLSKQLLVMVVLALLFGVLNNFRPSAKIKWVRDWQSFSDVAKKDTPEPEVVEEEPSVEGEPADILTSVTEQLASNFQITDVGIKTAERFYNYAKEFTLWIDARSPDLYDKGHIDGALLCYINDKNKYLPDLEVQIQERQPLALIIYCKGADCTDSHHLAEDLFGMGYENIFVYKDGFNAWFEAGLPVAGTMVTEGQADQAPLTAATVQIEEEKPPGMYLEHVFRDMIPFLFGAFLLVAWKRSRQSKLLMTAACWMLGLFFIWAALPKLQAPFAFAKSIWNYDILPGALINISALMMPSFELVAGLGLIFWVFRRGGGVITGALLMVFIIAVSFNMLRGHEFNCGCTSDKVYLTSIYLEGWNDKIMLLLRDFGLLVMSALAFLRSSKS